jgi:tetratricopeptide (TPR) repeat protein
LLRLLWRLSWRWAVAALLIAGVAAAHAKLPTERAVDDGDTWLPKPEVARLASLGFRNLLADYYWLMALQVVGGSTTDPSTHGPLIGRMVDLVTTLDPWVDHPYRFAAIWMTDSEESVRKADALLDRAIEHHPTDWRNHFYQGFNRFFYLEENGRAADAMEKASALPGAPAYLTRLVTRLRADADGLETAAAMLREMVQNAQDPYEQAEYGKALDEIETERQARILDAARAAFKERHGRDITRVEELVEGLEPVLKALPKELHDFEWTIDADTGRIVSSWYDHRYEPLINSGARQERERVRRSAASAKSQEG